VTTEKQVFTKIVFPNDANPHKTLFGGTAIAWMDQAAAIVAVKASGKPVVTVAMDKIEFSVPIRVGDMVEVRAGIKDWGKHSVTVVVDLVRIGPTGGEDELCTNGIFYMVAVDEKGHPILLGPRER